MSIVLLSDLVMLENYYGLPKSLFLEELERHYDRAAIARAVRARYLRMRRIICGPDAGRLSFTLTDAGRAAAVPAAQDLLGLTC